MKLQSFLINVVYWMFAFSLLKHSKTATEKVFSVADCINTKMCVRACVRARACVRVCGHLGSNWDTIWHKVPLKTVRLNVIKNLGFNIETIDV